MADSLSWNDVNGTRNKQGTGFVNAQDYVNANQNNQLGQTVGQGIQDVSNNASNNLVSAQTQFNQDANAANPASAQNQQNASNILNNAVNNPSQLTSQDYTNFQNYLSGQYKGPTGLSNTDQLSGQFNDVSQLGNATQTQGGQLGLLQRFAGNNQYNQGEQNLDQLILGQTGQPQLAQARQNAYNTANNYQNAQNAAQQEAQLYQNQAQQFGNQAYQNLLNKISPISATVAQEAQDYNTNLGNAIQDAKQRFSNTSGTVNLTPSDIQALGLTPGEHLWGVPLQNLLQFNNTQANQYTAATPEQAAQLNALARLGGNKITDPSILGYLNQNNVAQAGTAAKTPAYTFAPNSAQTLQSAIQGAEQQANSQAQGSMEYQLLKLAQLEMQEPNNQLWAGQNIQQQLDTAQANYQDLLNRLGYTNVVADNSLENAPVVR